MQYSGRPDSSSVEQFEQRGHSEALSCLRRRLISALENRHHRSKVYRYPPSQKNRVFDLRWRRIRSIPGETGGRQNVERLCESLLDRGKCSAVPRKSKGLVVVCVPGNGAKPASGFRDKRNLTARIKCRVLLVSDDQAVCVGQPGQVVHLQVVEPGEGLHFARRHIQYLNHAQCAVGTKHRRGDLLAVWRPGDGTW